MKLRISLILLMIVRCITFGASKEHHHQSTVNKRAAGQSTAGGHSFIVKDRDVHPHHHGRDHPHHHDRHHSMIDRSWDRFYIEKEREAHPHHHGRDHPHRHGRHHSMIDRSWDQPELLARNNITNSSNSTQQNGATMGEQQGSSSMKLFAAITTNILLFASIFGLSATVEVKNLKSQLTNKAGILAGVSMQFLAMPALGFAGLVMMQHVSGFSRPMGIMLLVVTSSPGGAFSNWWCSLFNADLALSVAMTSVSSILSLGFLPANLVLYTWLAYSIVIPDTGTKIDIIKAVDFGAIFITLGVVIGGVIFGLYAGYAYSSPTFHKRANKFGSICGLLLYLFSFFLGSGGGGGKANVWSMPWSFYVGTAFPCVAGMVLATMISRCLKLSPPEVVAVSIECCYQNTGIATSVAATMFSDPTERSAAVSVPLFYGFSEAILIGIYCLLVWKAGWTKSPANEKLLVVVTKTYEVGDEKEDDEMMEKWPANLNEMGWFARLFVPREIEEQRKKASEEFTHATNLSANM